MSMTQAEKTKRKLIRVATETFGADAGREMARRIKVGEEANARFVAAAAKVQPADGKKPE
jgi:hypothetical protein